MTPPPYDRRRAEDVFRELEANVFPRIGKIEERAGTLEKGIQEIRLRGCAHRDGDLLRIQVMESGVARIFEKIDDIGEKLSTHQVEMATQIGAMKTTLTEKTGGIRGWVYGLIISALVVLLIFLGGKYVENLERGMEKVPAIDAPR